MDRLILPALVGLSYSASMGYSVEAFIVVDHEMSLTVPIDLSNLSVPTCRPRRGG